MLIRGYILPLTARYLALHKGAPVSAFFRTALRAIAREYQSELPDLDLSDRMCVYENRDRLYTTALAQPAALYRALEVALTDWLSRHGADAEFIDHTRAVLALDAAFCPRVGRGHTVERTFPFAADRVAFHLNRMELPREQDFAPTRSRLVIAHPGGVGEVLKDPDGGSWFRGQPVEDSAAQRKASEGSAASPA
jgi:hypothetical protein